MSSFVIISESPLYMINPCGDVYSIKSKRKLKPWNKSSRKGNPYKYISIKINGEFKKIPVHRLVASAFIGDITGKMINHIDGNPSNNKLENLEICTAKRNTEHGFDAGLNTNYGDGHYQGKLTTAMAREIVLLKGLFTQKVIAEKYGVCRQTISDIHRGVIWSRALSL